MTMAYFTLSDAMDIFRADDGRSVAEATMGRMTQACSGGWLVWVVAAVLTLATSDLAQAQGAATPEPLTLEGIARDTAEWVGSAPSQIRWSQDGESLYFMWNPESADIPDLYVVARDGGTPEKVPSDELRHVPPRDAMRSRDETEAVYAAYGDLFLFTIADGTVRRLTDTDTTERDPHFLVDQRSVAFERDQNLFVVELDTGAVRQITNFRTGPDPDADPDQTRLQAPRRGARVPGQGALPERGRSAGWTTGRATGRSDSARRSGLTTASA